MAPADLPSGQGYWFYCTAGSATAGAGTPKGAGVFTFIGTLDRVTGGGRKWGSATAR